MCNLYRMTASLHEMRRLFGPFRCDGTHLPRFGDIYPAKKAPVLSRADGELALSIMSWGFPSPHPGGSPSVTNVRDLSSRYWRPMLSDRAMRCLVPATQFCLWTARPDPETGRKRKIWFGLDEPLFAFAGIWRPSAEGGCMAFLTCGPNSLVAAVNPKAMPVILRPPDFDRWLDGERAVALAKPHAASTMRVIA